MKFNFSTAALPSVCPPIRLSVICFCPYIHPIISYLSVLKLWGKTRNDDTHKNSGRRIIETKNLNTKCAAVLCLMYFKQVNYCTRKLRVYSFMPWKCDVYGLQPLFNEKSSCLLALKPLTSSCFQWLETSANNNAFHMKFYLKYPFQLSAREIIRCPESSCMWRLYFTFEHSGARKKVYWLRKMHK